MPSKQVNNGECLVDYSIERIGWCVYQRESSLEMRFHAGPFSEKAAAESESQRLNDLVRNSMATMDETYGDGTDHEVCDCCGLCITCGDCHDLGCGNVGRVDRDNSSETK